MEAASQSLRNFVDDYPTKALMATDLFKIQEELLTPSERVELSYGRARAVAEVYGLTAQDSLYCSQKFWMLHRDPYVCLDCGAGTILTIHYNLFMGTIARFVAEGRSDLLPLLKKAERFEITGQYLLTEIGRGLDAANLQTTVTLLPDGSFDLHTPDPSAAKFMPPTGPSNGLPKVAVVFARLMVQGEDRGVRPVLVALNDGREMCQGVSATMLPFRSGSKPMDHAITTFNHVRLPPNSLLGSLEAPEDLRANFFDAIWRVACGTVAIANMTIPWLKNASNIGIKYSLRRKTGPPGQLTPIFSFRTQQIPILQSLAKSFVMEKMGDYVIENFLNRSMDFRVRHGLAAIFKTIGVQHSQEANLGVSERLGAQGLFEHNMLSVQHGDARGNAIAEGDVLGLAIRLIPEILLGRYSMPSPMFPNSMLALHEAGLLAEKKAIISRIQGGHRSAEFNHLVLPSCQSMVEAIGHRMAYEAAVNRGVDGRLTRLYELSVMKLDLSWYVENGLITRQAFIEAEDTVIQQLLPDLAKFVNDLQIDAYSSKAPILSDESWENFVFQLPVHEGNSVVDLGLTKPRLTSSRILPLPSAFEQPMAHL